MSLLIWKNCNSEAFSAPYDEDNPNGIDVSEASADPSEKFKSSNLEHFQIMFLSRIHPKKGLEILLDALSKVKFDYTLRIYGDGESDYIHRLQKYSEELGIESHVVFRGHVEGDEKERAYKTAHLFALTSYSENFGIVIAEALANGVPVLTTNNTPWQVINSQGCGKSVELAVNEIVNGIVELRHSDLALYSRRARQLIKEQFSPEATGAMMEAVYRSLTGR